MFSSSFQITQPKMRLTQHSFDIALQYNQQVLRNTLQHGVFTAQDYYWIDQDGTTLNPPGTNKLRVTRMSDDAIAATIIGAIPFATNHGADALMYDTALGTFKPVEVKLCYKNPNDAFRSQHTSLNNGGSLFVGKMPIPAKPGSDRSITNKGLRGSMNAHYEIVHNIDSKAMDTFLIIIDENTNDIVTAVTLPGSAIIALLSKNAINGEDKLGKKRCIPLTKFLSGGSVVECPEFEVVGLYAWEARLRTQMNRFIGRVKNTDYFSY